MLVDTHTHFYDEWLLPDAEAAIQRALDAGVGKMIQADVDSAERPRMWEIGLRHPGVLFQMLGLYPGSVTAENWREELDQVYRIAAGDFSAALEMTGAAGDFSAALEMTGAAGDSSATLGMTGTTLGMTGTALGMTDFVAIGEIGLDYHEGKEFVREQKEVLRLQFELAAKLDLPVNIHLRDAWEDFFAVLEDCAHLHLRGNLHCFSGSYEVYQRANRSGDFSVGIGGVLTFKNASLPAVVARIPMEHILLETDAPYLAPVPYRGKRNESAYLPLVAARLAEIKGLSLNEIETITTDNAKRLFAI